MYDIFREKYCTQCCFKGAVYSTEIENVQLVECLRDNEDTKDRFRHTSNKDDINIWIQQSGNFLHCFYTEDNARNECEEKGKNIL